MYINLTEDSHTTHIAYVNCRPQMVDTVQNIELALQEHFDEKVTLPESLEADLCSRDHNVHSFYVIIGDDEHQIHVSDGWVY